jgi:hypothetical protein
MMMESDAGGLYERLRTISVFRTIDVTEICSYTENARGSCFLLNGLDISNLIYVGAKPKSLTSGRTQTEDVRDQVTRTVLGPIGKEGGQDYIIISFTIRHIPHLVPRG